MACILSSGIARGCRDSVGGIVEAYLGNYVAGSAQTWYDDDGSGTVTGISGWTGYTFVPTKNSSNWVENVNSSVENGTIGYEQVLTLIIPKNQASTREQIKLIGQANMAIIVRDKNEKYWLLGAQEGMELNGGNSASGAALADLNGWTLTISGFEPFPAQEVTSALIDGITTE